MRIRLAGLDVLIAKFFAPQERLKSPGRQTFGDCKECGVCLKLFSQKAIEPNEEM